MMRKVFSFNIVVFLSGILMCCLICGCGVRDEALVLSVEETEVEEAGNPGENASMETTGGVASGEHFGQGEMETPQSQSTDEGPDMIYVYVCGAVVNPGVVELPEGSRADDALREAGGFAEDAAKEFVNLAAKVADGEMLYFPTITEAEEQKLAEEEAAKGLVNINRADASQLMTLPGIGEAKARDIIAYREANGDFQTKEDLQKVPGIKENMYAKLCDKITIR